MQLLVISNLLRYVLPAAGNFFEKRAPLFINFSISGIDLSLSYFLEFRLFLSQISTLFSSHQNNFCSGPPLLKRLWVSVFEKGFMNHIMCMEADWSDPARNMSKFATFVGILWQYFQHLMLTTTNNILK